MPKAQTATKPKPAASRAGARPSTSRAAPKVAPKPVAPKPAAAKPVTAKPAAPKPVVRMRDRGSLMTRFIKPRRGIRMAAKPFVDTIAERC